MYLMGYSVEFGANQAAIQYINATRLFQTQPKWAALKRSDETDANDYRKNYTHAISNGAAS